MRRPKRKRSKTRNVLKKKQQIPALGQNFSSVPAGSVVASCEMPKNTNIPCDVETLSLMDKRTGTGVSCRHKSTGELPDPAAPQRIQDLLTTYDLVLECLADYNIYDRSMDRVEEQRERNQPKCLKLEISRTHFGNCPFSRHPLVELIARDQRDVNEARKWSIVKSTPTDILARDAQNLTGKTAWISRFWTFSSGDIKEF